MNARLTAIAGRLKGSVFTIEDLPVVIGRETAATLCIDRVAGWTEPSRVVVSPKDVILAR